MFFLLALLILKPGGIGILKSYLSSWLDVKILLKVSARICMRCPYVSSFPYIDGITQSDILC